MLRKISWKIAGISLKPQVLFAELGRNKIREKIAETDPIFPDLRDSHRKVYNVPHRAPLVQGLKKLTQAQVQMADYVLRRTQGNFNVKQGWKKDEKGSKEVEASQILISVIKEIKEDPILKLPYGMNFDEFIVKAREEKIKRESSKLTSLVMSIFRKLKVRTEFELAILHKHAFAKIDSENYIDRARKVVLQQFLKEIAKFREGDKAKKENSLERYFEKFSENKEFYIASLKDIGSFFIFFPKDMINLREDVGNEDAVLQKLEGKLKPEQVKKAAEQLSLQSLERNVEQGYEKFLKEYKPGYHDIFSFDKFFFGNHVTTSGDEEGPENHLYSYEVQMMNDEEFENYQLWRDLKKNYFRNKVEYVTNPESQQVKRTPEEEIFESKAGQEDDLNEAAKRMGLEDFYPKPDFDEIYSNIDHLVSSLPITSKKTGPQKILDMAPEDFLWNSVTTKFEKVIPKKYYKFSNTAKESETPGNISSLRLRDSVMDGVLTNEEVTKFKFERGILDDTVLSKEEMTELEVFKNVRKDPFFQHHLTNNLKYFSERMIESNLAVRSLTTPGQPNKDYLNYVNPTDEIMRRQFNEKVQENAKEEEKKRKKLENVKFFCGGRRKTSHALAIISPGRGIVKVNHVPIYDYFHEQYHRSTILYPIQAAQLECLVDVDLYVRGGGISAQVKSCQMALARCIIKKNPLLKTLFKKMALIQADRRQVERKHVGHYKARKKFPYKRR